MILMWLGSFVLLMWGLTSFQKNLAVLFIDFQKSIFNKGFSTSTPTLFLQSTGIALTEASPLRVLYSAMALFNLRILAVRPAVLIMCLSPLAVIPVLFLGSVFLNLSGFFVLGLCAVTLIRFWKSSSIDSLLKILFSVGIFLVGGESLLKNSSVVQTYLAQTDLVFFLLDGRFTAVFLLALGSFLASFLIQVEFWSLAFALSLLTTGSMSFNGALGFVLGERLAMAVLFWFRTRKLNQDCHRLGQQYALIAISSSVFGFWLAGESRRFFDIGFSTDLGAVQEKIFSFLIVFAMILSTQAIAGLVWGHFAGNKKAEELQDPKYFSPAWLNRGLLSEGQRSWAKEKVQKRLSEIRYHLAGLQSLKQGQVPEHIQARIKEEESQLSHLGL